MVTEMTDLPITRSSLHRHRPVDYVLCGYYAYQVCGSSLIESQAVYPEWFYPQFLRMLYHGYLEMSKDPYMADGWKYPWFLSFCFLEHFLAIPFSCYACYSYFHGALNKPNVILPSIISSTFCILAVTSVWHMALLEDFSPYPDPAPRTTTQRVLLCVVYSPMLLFSFVNLVDSFFLALNAIQTSPTYAIRLQPESI